MLRFVAGLSSTAGLLLASGLVLNWLLAHQRARSLACTSPALGWESRSPGWRLRRWPTSWPPPGQWMALGALAIVFLVPAWAWMPAPVPHLQRDRCGRPPAPGRRWRGLLIASYFCAGFGFVVSATFIVAILVQTPAFAGHGSWVWVLVGLTAIPSTFAWDRLAARLGLIRALMLAYALQTVSFVLPLLDDGLRRARPARCCSA